MFSWVASKKCTINIIFWCQAVKLSGQHRSKESLHWNGAKKKKTTLKASEKLTKTSSSEKWNKPKNRWGCKRQTCRKAERMTKKFLAFYIYKSTAEVRVICVQDVTGLTPVCCCSMTWYKVQIHSATLDAPVASSFDENRNRDETEFVVRLVPLLKPV